MEKEKVLNILENMLDLRLKEYPTRSLASCREDILYYAKQIELIKDYYYTTNRVNNGIYFGSCVGFDRQYKVIL